MNILLVGGTFDSEGGHPSGFVTKMYGVLFTILSALQAELGSYITEYNGGYYYNVRDILEEAKEYDVVIWMPNIPNEYPKIRNAKEVAPYCLLVSSKRNDGNKYSLQELINHSLGLKANLTLEIKKEESLFHMMFFDPLGTMWYAGTKLNDCMQKLVDRMLFLKSITRQKTVKSEDDPRLVMDWYIDHFKQDEFKSEENPEIPQEEEFVQIVKQYTVKFHELMVPAKDVQCFLGNASLLFYIFYIPP